METQSLQDLMTAVQRTLTPEEQALSVALAGCETRSDLLQWIQSELVGNPDAYARVEPILRQSDLAVDAILPLRSNLLRDALLDYLQDMSISVSTDWEKALSLLRRDGVEPIADLHRHVCGLVYQGELFINPEITEVSTPIHEYTHLWAAALRYGNPDEWSRVVYMFRTSSFWDDAVRRYGHLTSDDAIAEELLADYSGQQGASLLGSMEHSLRNQSVTERSSIGFSLSCIRQALSHFWHEVAGFLHIRYSSPEEVAKQVLRDFLSGVNPVQEGQPLQERLPKFCIGEIGAELNDNTGVDFTPEMRQIIEKAKLDGTLGLAPNGAQSNLDLRQWAQVRTDAFKRWFGDWEHDPANASQVIDQNGEPLVVYHGTAKGGFSVFNNEKASNHSFSPTGAIWFSNDPIRAMSYAGNRKEITEFNEDDEQFGIYSCFLNARRMYFSDFDGADWEGIGHELYELRREDEYGNFIELVTNSEGLDYFKSGEEAEAEAERLGLEYYTITNNHWLCTNVNTEAAMVLDNDLGDGLRILNVIDNGRFGGDEVADDYVVFSPYQIKSASCNRGQFDPLEADIRYQLIEQTASLCAPDLKQELLGEIHQALIMERDLIERNWLDHAAAALRSGETSMVAEESSRFVRTYSEVCRLVACTERLLKGENQQRDVIHERTKGRKQ